MKIHTQAVLCTLAGATLLMVASACNSSNPASGTAAVQGSLQGKSFAAQSALFYQVADSNQTSNPNGAADANSTAAGESTAYPVAGNANSVATDGNSVADANFKPTVIVQLSTQSGVCADAENDRLTLDAASIALKLSGTQPGTYSIGAPAASTAKTARLAADANSVAGDTNSTVGNPNVVQDGNSTVTGQLVAQYSTVNSQCDTTDAVSATQGSVTITSNDSNSIRGSFNLTFSTGNSLQGQFTAAQCSALSNPALACQ